MLLKALVKHDKPRLLIHECDLNRWILRNALQSHPLGSAAPNASLSEPQAAVWILGEEVVNTLESLDSGCWSASVSRNVSNGAVRGPLEEEKVALEFLENVLSHREGVCSKGTSSVCKLTTIIAQDREDRFDGDNSQATLNGFLSKGYWCQIMLDVAEVHFMRGRIQDAHELFTNCAELNQRISETDKTSSDGAFSHLRRASNADTRRLASSVPMQRLAGFIIACRMLLGLHPKSTVNEGRQRDLNEIVLKSSSLLSLGEPSAAQKMVIACERSRYNLKQESAAAQPLVRKTLEEGDFTVLPPHKKLKAFHNLDSENATNPGSREVGSIENVDMRTTGPQGSEGLTTTSKIEESECKKSESVISAVDDAGVPIKVRLIDSTETKSEEVVNGVDGSLQTKDAITIFKRRILNSMSLKVSGDEDLSAGREQECIRLIRNVVGDTLEGHLKKGYRISMARDSDLPVSIHCQLVACNVVRDIVEKAPMQSFLQSSNAFRDNIEGVNFFMSLMAAVKKSFDESAKLYMNGTVPEPQATERMYSREGYDRTSIYLRSITDCSSSSKYISEYALYVCCVLDRRWCWETALRNNLISPAAVPKPFISEHYVNGCKESTQELLEVAAESRAVSLTRNVATGSLGDLEKSRGDHFHSTLSRSNALVNTVAPVLVPLSGNEVGLEAVLCALLTAEDVWEIERLVSKVDRLSEALRMKDNLASVGALFTVDHVKVGNDRTGGRISLALDVAAVLRRRAFNALDTTKQLWVARKFYELAKTIHNRDHDSMMMLWLLDKVSLKEGAFVSLPGLEEFDKEISLDLGAVEYVLLSLIEKELWNDLSELCEWGLSIVKKGRSTGIGTHAEGPRKGQGIGKDIWYRRCAQILNVATALAELMQLCSSLLSATGHNHFTEDVAKTSQIFEDFLCLLIGGDVEGSSSGAEDGNLAWGAHARKVALLPLNPSIRAVPLISQLTNSRVLMSLASLMAGWLQRGYKDGLTPWPLSIERYGRLAVVTSGTSLPPLGPLPHGAGVFSPSRVAPAFGRNLFGALLERIVELPGVVERDKENGHRWLQGLADLAYEDEAHVKALQLYLQAGGIKSAYYCDRSSAMTEEVFTQWVIQRMVQGCRIIGATVQAALLCQKLPGPDHEAAFQILQENSLIVVRDAVAYFDCVWEVPLLELLVHMHAKSGDHERHSALISLLQQPALNAHNPQSVRVAHVASLEQRFLQRLCGELL